MRINIKEKFQRLFLASKQRRLLLTIFLADFFICMAMTGYYNGKTGRGEEISFTQDEFILARKITDGNGTFESREPGRYIDQSYEGTERRIETPSFTLGKGMYTITINYGTLAGSGSANITTKNGILWHRLYSTGSHLPAGMDTVSWRIYCKGAPQEMLIQCNLASDAEDYVLIEGISVRPEKPSLLWCIAAGIFFMLVSDLILWGLSLWGERLSPVIWLGLAVIMFLACYPLLTDYTLLGDDIRFHLMRIEGIKEGLRGKNFPVKIQPNWGGGNGYAVGTMYGDILLYFPALLRLIDVPVQTAYKLYVALINLLTVGISFFSFSRISGDKRCGLLGSALYTLAMYRLTDVYLRAAVGEYTALTFFPLILCGLYLLYKENSSHAVPVLVIGFSGIIQSHVLSSEMAAFFTILVCVVLWKKTFQKAVILIWLKTAGWLLAVNAWFLVPFLDYFFNMSFGIRGTVNQEYEIQEKGLSLVKLFSLQPDAVNGLGVSAWGGETDFRLACTVGISFTMILLFYFYQVIGQKRYFRNAEGRICIVLSCMALFMTTAYFPYNWLGDHISVLRSLIGSIQFPWRFLAIAVTILCWLACIVVRQTEDEKDRRKLLYLLCMVIGMQGWYTGDALLTGSGEKGQIYVSDSLDTYEALSNEYAQKDTKMDSLLAGPVGSDGVTVREYSKMYTNITVRVENVQPEGYIEVPLLYYRGYRATDGEGRKYEVTSGTNHQVRVSVPEGTTSLQIGFVEPPLWRIAELCSLAAVMGALVSMLSGRKERRKKENK